MAKMIYLASSYLVLVIIFNCFFCRRAASAYCCQSKSKSASLPDRNSWLSDVGTLDELHLRLMKKAILNHLQIEKVPEEAPRWRNTRSVAALLEQTQQFNFDDKIDNNDDTTRYYSLKVVGLQTNKSIARGRKRIHHKHHNGHKGCAAHFEFLAKPTATGSTFEYKTILEKAELQLPLDGVFILHTNYSTTLDRVPDADQTYFSDRNSDSSSVQGRNRIVDVTSVLRSFWSLELGTKVSLTWRSRHACRLYRDPADGGESSSSLQNIQPILRLHLKETKSMRYRSLSKRQIDINFSKNRRRQDIIIDCEQQWDLAFLQNVSDIYDSLMPCCRRKVKVDFTELGWDQWVVAPQTFDSYYCIGRCTYFGGFASEDTEGASFYTELMNLQRRARNSGLQPCCSPVKFSPLTITVLTGDNEEMTQTLEDVVVKQCGCM